MLIKRILVITIALITVSTTAGRVVADSAPLTNQQKAIIAEPKPNTTNAQREELKDAITQSITNSPAKVIVTAKKLLGLENPDDVIYLINLMIQNQKKPLAIEIKKVILKYDRKDYLVSALKKAGQDQSTDVNIAAANLLIDMKEELEGLKVMVSLIKKGVMAKEIIDIMDRVPNRDKLNGEKIANGQMLYNVEIQRELETIGLTSTYPQDVQVFALLMHAAYYYYYLANEQGKIADVLVRANHEYLMNALNLLRKAVDIYQHDPNVPWELVAQLKQSKDLQVAKLAREIDEWCEEEEKKRWRNIIGETRDVDKTYRDVVLRDYLNRFGDTKSEIDYLLNVLRNNQNDEVRCRVINSLSNSKKQDIIIGEINNRAQSDYSTRVRSCAISYLINKGMEDRISEYYKKMLEMMVRKETVTYYDISRNIKNEGIKREIKEYQLYAFKNMAKSDIAKGFLLLCLSPEKIVADAEYQSILANALENPKTDKVKMLIELMQWTESNNDINISLLTKMTDSKNIEIASSAKNVLIKLQLRRR